MRGLLSDRDRLLLARRRASDRQEVARSPEHRCFGFDKPSRFQDRLLTSRIFPSALEVVDAEDPGTLDIEHSYDLQAYFGDFINEVLRLVEIRDCEKIPFSSVKHAGTNAGLCDPKDLGLVQPVEAHEKIEERGEPRDRRGEEQSARPHHPSSLSQCAQTVVAFDEVVKRPEEKHDVDRSVRLHELSGITELGRHVGTCRPSLLNMERDRVDEMNTIPTIREPRRVNAGSAADIEDLQWRRAEVPQEDLLRAREL